MQRSSVSIFNIYQDYPIGMKTCFKTKGIAEYYSEPRDLSECLIALEYAYSKNINVSTIGAGTHVLVSDEGVPGLVISSKEMKGIAIKGVLVEAMGGEMLNTLINTTIDHNLIGLEPLGGLPGTIAGAIASNASAHGISISQFEFYTDYLTIGGRMHRIPNYCDMNFMVPQDSLMIGTALRLRPSKQTAEARMRKEEFVEIAFIPPAENFSGYIFRNIDEKKLANLLERKNGYALEGCKAEFSKYQSNSIFTYPGCTASEIDRIINHVSDLIEKEEGERPLLALKKLGAFS